MMNISSFSMPQAAYTNPTAYGDFTGINYAAWLFAHLFFELKFISIFSILFGIGVFIFCRNAEERTGGSVILHYKRMFWLMVFGILHGHLIWYGDILFGYAICGAIIYLLKDSSVKKLWTVGGCLVAASWLITVIGQVTLPYISPAELDAFRDIWQPPISHLDLEIAAYTGSWIEQFQERSPMALFLETFGIFYYIGWFNTGMMLIGIALYKQGLFSKAYQPSTLLLALIALFVVGFSLITYGVIFNERADWVMEKSQYAGTLFNSIGGILVAIGYLVSVVLFYQLGFFLSLFQTMAAVGKLAFTNYISQSLVCTFIFYGFGLGLFGSVERWQQVFIVVIIWLVQVKLSVWWLNRHKQGPLELLWRKLTYS